jgi:hypothetical protein
MSRAPLRIVAAAVALKITIVALFHGFYADDAYIVYRYAERLVQGKGLTFNDGEPISALTSPFHALLAALLYAVTRHTPEANLAASILADGVSLGAAVWALSSRPRDAALFAVVVAPMPFIALWTVGGLETPFLLAMITAITLIARRPDAARPARREVLLYLLVGAAFLARYDSSVVTAPIAIATLLRSRARGRTLLAALPGAAVALGWLAFARAEYHDVFPTSFHVKTPGVGARLFVANGAYLAQTLVLTGLVVLLAPIVKRAVASAEHRSRALAVVRERAGLYVGLALLAPYALTAMTTHMMFSARFLVPYLPAIAIASIDLLAAMDPDRERRPEHHGALAAAILAGHALLGWVEYAYSINPFFRYGEYRKSSVRESAAVMPVFRAHAAAIRAHWQRQPESARRPLRLDTHAAGVLPYLLPDAYVYEQLVSFRRGCPRPAWIRPSPYAGSADYILVTAPLAGTIEQQLPKPEGAYEVVSEGDFALEGFHNRMIVYFQRDPAPNWLPPTLDAPCLR